MLTGDFLVKVIITFLVYRDNLAIFMLFEKTPVLNDRSKVQTRDFKIKFMLFGIKTLTYVSSASNDDLPLQDVTVEEIYSSVTGMHYFVLI